MCFVCLYLCRADSCFRLFISLCCVAPGVPVKILHVLFRCILCRSFIIYCLMVFKCRSSQRMTNKPNEILQWNCFISYVLSVLIEKEWIGWVFPIIFQMAFHCDTFHLLFSLSSFQHSYGIMSVCQTLVLCRCRCIYLFFIFDSTERKWRERERNKKKKLNGKAHTEINS